MMAADINFTGEEIMDELLSLGYVNVPQQKLAELRRDLEALIERERLSNTDRDTWTDSNSNYLSYPSHTTTQYYTSNHTTALNNQPYTGPYSNQAARFDDDIQNGTSVLIGNTGRTYSKNLETERNVSSVDGMDKENQLSSGRRAVSAGVRGGVGQSGEERGDSLGASRGGNSRQMKRKVLRKDEHGRVEISESVTASECDDMSLLEERLTSLSTSEADIPRSAQTPVSARSVSARSVSARSVSARSTGSARSADSSKRCPSRSSIIHGMLADPHGRSMSRSDPVTRYQRYKSGWSSQRAPGERAHKDLRWSIREKMLHHDTVVEKKPRNYKKNEYIVPTDKKRKSLRWQIREDLALGHVRPASSL